MKASDINAYLINGHAEYLPQTASTNDDAKAAIRAGAAEGTVIVAGTQTAGRGRLTKSFYSPESGAYFSLILKPNGIDDTSMLTVYAALAVCDAAQSVFGVSAGVKWVNDVYYDNKKCAGILTEAVTSPEGKLLGVVIGIGVNVYAPEGGFPTEIKDIAGALTERGAEDLRAKFIAETVDKLVEYYRTSDKESAVKSYRDKSVLSGKRVSVTRPSGTFFATVYGIDDDCRLTVLRDDGRLETLSVGDVSICRL